MGVAVSLVGVLVIITQGQPWMLLHLGLNIGDAAILFGILLYAAYPPLLRRGPDIHPLSLLACLFAAGAGATAPLWGIEMASGRFMRLEPGAFAAIGYVSIVASVLAYLFFNRGVALIGAGRAGQFVHLMPVFGAVLAVLLLHERFHLFHLFGVALIAAGIGLASIRRPAPGRAGCAMTELRPPCVILAAPQLAENIGSVARAMANFGLVGPAAGQSPRRLAPGAGLGLGLGRRVAAEQCARCSRGLRMRWRISSWCTPPPRGLARCACRCSRRAKRPASCTPPPGRGRRRGSSTAPERAGLESDDVALCQGIVTIPVDEKFKSLNLAQSVAVTAYEWRMAVLDRPPAAFKEAEPPAEQAALLGLYGQLEAGA